MKNTNQKRLVTAGTGTSPYGSAKETITLTVLVYHKTIIKSSLFIGNCDREGR